MKSLQENLTINESSAWEITDNFDYGNKIGTVNPPRNYDYIYIGTQAETICFVTKEAVRSNFIDFDMEYDWKQLQKIGIGESYSNDGVNIYVRVK